MVFTIRAIIEVMGFPEEHIKEVSQKIVEKIKAEDRISIIKETTHNTEKVKEQFFSCFIEIEMKVNDLSKLFGFCYDYLPSSIEILDTEKITMPTREFHFAINEMLEKLHHYNITVNNIKSAFPNNHKFHSHAPALYSTIL